jgi:hypothetical protein
VRLLQYKLSVRCVLQSGNPSSRQLEAESDLILSLQALTSALRQALRHVHRSLKMRKHVKMPRKQSLATFFQVDDE